MKPAALLCFALALTVGALRGYLQRGITEFRVGNMIEAARYAVDALDRATALHNRLANVGPKNWPTHFIPATVAWPAI